MTGRHGLRRFKNPENERSWIFVRLSGYGRISENIAYTAGFRSAIRRDFGRLRPDFVRLSGWISGGYGRKSTSKTIQKPDKNLTKPHKNQTKASQNQTKHRENQTKKLTKHTTNAGKTQPIRPDFVRLSGRISGGYGRISFGYPAGFRVATVGKTPAKPNK